MDDCAGADAARNTELPPYGGGSILHNLQAESFPKWLLWQAAAIVLDFKLKTLLEPLEKDAYVLGA